MSCPCDDFVDSISGSGNHGLDAAVAAVAHPAGNAKLVCDAAGVKAKTDALDAARDD